MKINIQNIILECYLINFDEERTFKSYFKWIKVAFMTRGNFPAMQPMTSCWAAFKANDQNKPQDGENDLFMKSYIEF